MQMTYMTMAACCKALEMMQVVAVLQPGANGLADASIAASPLGLTDRQEAGLRAFHDVAWLPIDSRLARGLFHIDVAVNIGTRARSWRSPKRKSIAITAAVEVDAQLTF